MAEQEPRERARCICGCGQRAVHLHHAVYRQHVTRHGGDLRDPRNLVPVAFTCHGGHHSGAARLRLSRLPDAVFDFAAELMGAAAYDYLRRRYAGEDPRLNGLLG
jgi:integrase